MKCLKHTRNVLLPGYWAEGTESPTQERRLCYLLMVASVEWKLVRGARSR